MLQLQGKCKYVYVLGKKNRCKHRATYKDFLVCMHQQRCTSKKYYNPARLVFTVIMGNVTHHQRDVTRQEHRTQSFTEGIQYIIHFSFLLFLYLRSVLSITSTKKYDVAVDDAVLRCAPAGAQNFPRKGKGALGFLPCNH